MTFAFNYDTPKFLKQNGNSEELTELMNKIYITPEVAEERIELIHVVQGSNSSVSYGQLLCDQKYRYATWSGLTFAIFNQLTGIQVITFYSNLLFRGLDVSSNVITAIVGTVNLLTNFGGIFLLVYLKFKVQLITFNSLLTVDLFALSYFCFERNTIMIVVTVTLFQIFFVLSTGSQIWIYLSQTMHEKSLSIAVSIIWILSLVVSVTIPLIIQDIEIGFIFLFLAIS